MKPPLLNHEHRLIMRYYPKTLKAADLKRQLAVARLMREINRTRLFTFINKLLT